MSAAGFGWTAAAALPSGVTGRRPNSDLRIDRDAHPGWHTGAEHTPTPGDRVVCSAGAGEIVAVRGKTGDGSRLVEIRLERDGAPPFFAAASNVLLAPGDQRQVADPAD
jgi:hypothetical protein